MSRLITFHFRVSDTVFNGADFEVFEVTDSKTLVFFILSMEAYNTLHLMTRNTERERERERESERERVRESVCASGGERESQRERERERERERVRERERERERERDVDKIYRQSSVKTLFKLQVNNFSF